MATVRRGRHSDGTATSYARLSGFAVSQGQPVSQGQVGTYDAGPMRRAAPGTCVTWGGSITGTSYASPFEHCG